MRVCRWNCNVCEHIAPPKPFLSIQFSQTASDKRLVTLCPPRHICLLATSSTARRTLPPKVNVASWFVGWWTRNKFIRANHRESITTCNPTMTNFGGTGAGHNVWQCLGVTGEVLVAFCSQWFCQMLSEAR